jgi:hypothetical protein
MAKKEKPSKLPAQNAHTYAFKDEEELLNQLQQHHLWWTDDNQMRITRKSGWRDIIDAYWGKLPDDWPFISKTVDPRIRTSLLEKNARLTNRTLKGKVIPREGGDIIKARVNNAIIDYQWDSANEGGSMQQKISSCDMDSRINGSKFAYIYWRTLKKDDEILFDGNELRPLDINDCGMDPNCDHIRNAKWFQHAIWMPIEDLELNKDLYPGYDELMSRIKSDKYAKVAQQRRDNKYINRIKQNKGLEDRMGTDEAFPVVRIVVEYRTDKWITFAPDYNLILSVIDNPYDHQKIPIAQLKYYPIEGDNLGESEVEPVLPLWKAIQAVMCAFLDEVILKMRPPLKVVEGSARIETLVYQPEAHWLMDNPNAVMEVESRGDSIKYFQNTYPALVSAFNVAMGDLSQGTSNMDPMQGDKTATEIRQIAKQQNTRDQKNQQQLAEFIKDVISMWIVNNKQFLFRDPKKSDYVLRILGGDNFEYFKRAGMDEMVLPEEVATVIGEIQASMSESGVDIPEEQLNSMIESGKIPRYPVVENPEEKDASKMEIKPKLREYESGGAAELSVIPEDLEGMYDYIPDVKSMEASSGEQLMFARTQAIAQVTNPNVLQLLAAQGYKPLIKDLLVSDFEDKGLQDAQKFFEAVAAPQGAPQEGVAPTGGVLPIEQNPGMGNVPQAPSQAGIEQQMARPDQVQG